jgi:hypothetical protein
MDTTTIDPKVIEFVRVVSARLTDNLDSLGKTRFVHYNTFIRLDFHRRGFWAAGSEDTTKTFYQLAHEFTALLAEYGSVFDGWEYTAVHTQKRFSLALVKEVPETELNDKAPPRLSSMIKEVISKEAEFKPHH